MTPLPYIRGRTPTRPHPLENYFSSYRQGVVEGWLRSHSPGDGLILDPFGSSPRMILEAARGGRRILAAVNNPITRLVLRRLAQPLPPDRLKAAAAALAGAFKGKERLEPHLLSLYETECPHCGASLSARAFLWNLRDHMPVRKICECSRCGDQGEYPTNQADIEKALRFQDNSLYHARALTRVAPPDNPVHTRAEKALQIYPSRAVYALFNLINKFTGLPSQANDREPLTILLLTAFSKGHGLQPKGPGDGLPARLKLPGSYRENNIWYAFEEGIALWSAEGDPVPVLEWPDLPPASGGITLFPGRFQDLAPELADLPLTAAAAVPPRPEPVLWTLSALWSGWLWGQDAAASLRGVLSLPTLEWSWYARAVEHNLSILSEQAPADLPLLEALSGLSSAYLVSTYTATRAAGFKAEGAALDPDSSSGLLAWSAGQESEADPDEHSIKEVLRDGGYRHLKECGQPRHTWNLQAAGLEALSRNRLIPLAGIRPVEDTLDDIQNQLEETYAFRQGFLHYPDSETWWHQELPLDPLPLSDQVEIEVVNLLMDNQILSRAELEKALYGAFPGPHTPTGTLIDLCLQSYGEPVEGEDDRWGLKSGERPEKRVQDLEEMAGLLLDIGGQLGFETRKQPPIGQVQVYRWSADGAVRATFFLSASGLLNKILLKYTDTPPHPWIILPGSRARLVTHKLHKNPPVAEVIDQDWGFLKFRHLRRLAEEGSLTRNNYHERFRLDPLTYDAPQLPLI